FGDPQSRVSNASKLRPSSEKLPDRVPPRNMHTPAPGSMSAAVKRVPLSDPENTTSSVGQFGMSSSSVTESPFCVMRPQTPLLISPIVVPHPQPLPVDERTVASAIQFA